MLHQVLQFQGGFRHDVCAHYSAARSPPVVCPYPHPSLSPSSGHGKLQGYPPSCKGRPSASPCCPLPPRSAALQLPARDRDCPSTRSRAAAASKAKPWTCRPARAPANVFSGASVPPALWLITIGRPGRASCQGAGRVLPSCFGRGGFFKLDMPDMPDGLRTARLIDRERLPGKPATGDMFIMRS